MLELKELKLEECFPQAENEGNLKDFVSPGSWRDVHQLNKLSLVVEI